MRHFLLLVFVGLLMAGASHAQDISFYGFIKSETIHDTRQVAQVREGQFLLYPLAFSVTGVLCLISAGAAWLVYPPHLDEAQEPFTINGFIHNAHLFGR